MHEAAQRGETLQLQQLIESGACVNQVTVDSITPLHVASLRGQAQCVQLLLAAGAQVSGPSGQTLRLAVAVGMDGTSSRGNEEAWDWHGKKRNPCRRRRGNGRRKPGWDVLEAKGGGGAVSMPTAH